MGRGYSTQRSLIQISNQSNRFPSTLKIEAVGSSETLVPIYQTVWSHIREEGDRVINLDAVALTFLFHEVSHCLPVIRLQECS
jgi:hypothetical protein